MMQRSLVICSYPSLLAGPPTLMCPCVGVNRRTSLKSSSLLLYQDPACRVHLTWIVCELGGKWPYSWCFAGFYFQDLSKQHVTSLYSSHLAFSKCISLAFIWCIHTVALTQPQLGRNPVLFFQRIQISYFSKLSRVGVNRNVKLIPVFTFKVASVSSETMFIQSFQAVVI